MFVLFIVVLAAMGALALAVLLSRGGRGDDAGSAATLTQDEVVDALLRSGAGPGGVDLEFLYAPAWYFEWAARELPETTGEPVMAFFMFENVHEGDIPASLPDVTLRIGGTAVESVGISEVSNAPHHRASQLLFPVHDPAAVETAPDLALTVPLDDGTTAGFVWDLPMAQGVGILNTDPTTTPVVGTALSVGALLAIFGGMLTALSPCLLLLATYYTAVLGGSAAGGDHAAASRRLLTTGLFFVAGFTVIYTAGGFAAGYIGGSLSRLGSVGSWSRPGSLVAGVAVVVLGIRVASQARVPVACKLPVMNRPASSGWVGSALMGSTFAFGCLSCFSATVLSALLLYAGATGSPVTGGLIMLVFSAAVGVVFLVAAWLVAQAAPLMSWLERARPYIGGASAVVMIGLGVLMITYKFHILTGYLFRLWS